MIDGFCRVRDLEKANDLFLEMEEKGCAPNVVVYNVLMRSFCENNELQKVLELLHKMVERELSPDDSTVSIVLDLLSKDEKYRECLDLLPTFPTQEPGGCNDGFSL
ncbi:hypothetical protein F2P56_002924 [Juglans regia]|uniref:Uncharacterized protein n=1 Tax=Juglans regia TaxID=51240 RepID=A0A833YFG8_JUGRE|nr:hypothetical protein F2P56_002924 [Juglans regia]